MKTLASRLNQALTTANLTASDLARQVGVSHVAIGHILNGRNTDVRSQLAAKIATALKCDLTWLIIGQPEEGRSPAIDLRTFAGRLRHLIKLHGWSQLDAAKAFSVSPACISRQLNEVRTSITAHFALRIVRSTGCDIGWLLTGLPLVIPHPQASLAA